MEFVEARRSSRNALGEPSAARELKKYGSLDRWWSFCFWLAHNDKRQRDENS